MEINHKNDITVKVCKEMKSRGMVIDYELYHKIMKMIYKSQGKNGDYIAKKELEEYKSSTSGLSNGYYVNNFYNKNSTHYGKNYNNSNEQKVDRSGFNGKWRK